MEVWIIRDGEKMGPFQDFEIRRKIGTYEVTAETPAWHDGQENWKPIGELDIFRNEFEKKPKDLTEEAADPDSSPKPPPLPEQPVYWRRFFARWFDLHIYSACWWILIWFCGVDLDKVWGNPFAMLLQLVPWFAFESYLLHQFGTTPGKWLLGLRVRNIDNSLLTLAAGMRRSLRVLLAGIGLGWWLPFTAFCQGISLFVAKRFGNALWDFSGGHRVLSESLKAWRVVVLVLGMFAALQVQVRIILPWIPQEQIDEVSEVFPQWKEQMEKNPPLVFPKHPR